MKFWGISQVQPQLRLAKLYRIVLFKVTNNLVCPVCWWTSLNFLLSLPSHQCLSPYLLPKSGGRDCGAQQLWADLPFQEIFLVGVS